MRSLVLTVLFVALAWGAGGALAQSYERPEDLVAAIYGQYETDAYLDYETLYSERLGGLYDEAVSGIEEGEMGPLDFDPFINAQDYDIGAVEIGAPTPEGERTRRIMKENDVRYLVFHKRYPGADWRAFERRKDLYRMAFENGGVVIFEPRET